MPAYTPRTRNGRPYPPKWSDLPGIRLRIEALQASDQLGADPPWLDSWPGITTSIIHLHRPNDAFDDFIINSRYLGQPLTRPDLVVKQLSPQLRITQDKVIMIVWFGREQGEVGMNNARKGVREYLELIDAGPDVVGLAISTCSIEAREIRRVPGTTEGFMEGGAMNLLNDVFLDWLRKALAGACE